MLQRIGSDRISGAQVCPANCILPIELVRYLIDVAPNFGIVRCATRVEDAGHLPRSLSEINHVANVGVREAIVNGLTDHDFALTLPEPLACHEFHLGTELQSFRPHSAERDVSLAGTVLTWKIYDDHPLARNHRLALAVFGYPWKRRQNRQLVFGEASSQLGGRSFA